MSSQPRIAVLIPSYDAERVIGKAIHSLNANAEPHDIVIVDDGSRNPLQDFLSPQPNMIILRLDKNVGVAHATNHGLKYILDHQYEFVARHDADDLALPDRLSIQRAFMDEHPQIALTGGWGQVISEQGDALFYLNYPTDHGAIFKALYYNNCFLHPTLMIRTEIFRKIGLYSENYPSNSEDYELMRRVASQAKVANIPQYLIEYTLSPNGLSLGKRHEQLRTRLQVQWEYRNFGSVHFYLGILKTIMLWAIPMNCIMAIKKRRIKYRKQ